MPLRTRLFIIISLVVLFVLGVSVLLLIRAKKQKEAAATIPTETNIIDQNNFNPAAVSGGGPAAPLGNLPTKPATKQETEQNKAKQLAIIFVERYNSFSTENNYQNIKDIQELVTPALWKKLSARLGTPQKGPYMGVTTEVISSSIAAWKDTAATLVFKVRRTTQKDGATEEKYQTITVESLSVAGTWLVDSYKVE